MSTLIQAVVTSFGYGHAPAPDSTVTLDVRRLLRNPHHDPVLRHMTGRDLMVIDHVMRTPGASALVVNTVILVEQLLADAGNAASTRVDVAVGCVGGRHRSVALAEAIAAALTVRGIGVELEHRDIDKPVLSSGC